LAHLRDLLSAPRSGGDGNAVLAIWQYLRTSGNAMLTVVGNVVLVPLVLFYLLYDRHQMFRRMESLIPRRWLAQTRAFVIDIDRMLSQYLRGQLLVMVVLAAFYPIALTLAGFEIALPLGLFTGLAVFIPYVGFAAGLALAVLAAVLQFGDLYGIGAVAVVYGLGQILENVFLTPRLIGERIGLHPLAVIFALLAFGQMFGFVGVLVALPVSAVLLVAIRRSELAVQTRDHARRHRRPNPKRKAYGHHAVARQQLLARAQNGGLQVVRYFLGFEHRQVFFGLHRDHSGFGMGAVKKSDFQLHSTGNHMEIGQDGPVVFDHDACAHATFFVHVLVSGVGDIRLHQHDRTLNRGRRLGAG
jgi:hypothetical protein